MWWISFIFLQKLCLDPELWVKKKTQIERVNYQEVGDQQRLYIKLMSFLPLRAGIKTSQHLHQVFTAGCLHHRLVPSP